MDTEILKILSTYGVETIVIALLINLLTNLAKKPIKAYSSKSGKDINKYISLMPVVLGFIGSVLYYGFTVGWTSLSFENVFTLGLSSASLSLAIFAVFEKFFPKAKGQTIDLDAAEEAINAANKIYNTIKNEKYEEFKTINDISNENLDNNEELRDELKNQKPTEGSEPNIHKGKKIILGHKLDKNDRKQY